MDKSTLALQKLLNDKIESGLIEDGVYGPATAKAVRTYLGEDTTSQVITSATEPKTEHFCLKEYYSNAIVGGQKIIRSVKPPEELYSNIQLSMDRLEELREALGGLPITITSGYRTPDYNEHIGGAENSAHMRGSAADIVVKGLSPKDVYAVADKLYPEGGVGLYSTFVHVDLDTVVDRPKRW